MKIVIQWIPLYSGITLNETADQLEKEGSKLSQPPSNISYEKAKTLLKNTATQELLEENEGYTFKNDSIHMLDRKGQTTLFRLRSGHRGLNIHLKKVVKAEGGKGRICAMPMWSDRTDPIPHPYTPAPTLRKPDVKFGLQKLQSARGSGGLATTY